MTSKRSVCEVFAAPRCGATVVRAILYDASDGRVPVHTHTLEKLTGVPVVAVLRDFRDAAASYWRVTVGKFDDTTNHRSATIEEAYSAALKIKGYAERYHHLCAPKIWWVRYEDWAGDIRKLCRLLNPVLPEAFAQASLTDLSEKWCKSAVRMMAASRAEFGDYDEEYHIHGHHVYKGEIGGWRNTFPVNSHRKVQAILYQVLQRWGYII